MSEPPALEDFSGVGWLQRVGFVIGCGISLEIYSTTEE
ncbi:hypothetical protein WCLP8_3630008 [uncultured Gammaproteobacteria bacterium]